MAPLFLGRSRSIAFSALLVISTPAAAEQQLSATTLVDQVLASNLELAADSELGTQTTAIAVTQGRLADPRISIGFAPKTLGNDIGSREIFKISQAIPWFGKLNASRMVADSNARATENWVASRNRDMSLMATTLWAEWWHVHQAISVNQHILRSYESLTRSADTRYQNGQGKQQDALQSKVRLLHARHQLVTLIQQKRRIGIQLNKLRNKPLDSSVLPPTALPVMPKTLDTTSLLAVIENHPEYRSAKDKLEASVGELALAKRERYPDFVAEAAYVGTLDPEEKRWQVGLGVNLPFDQAKRRSRITAAIAGKNKLQINAEAKLLELKEDLRLTTSRYQEHVHIQKLYAQELLPVAKRNQQAAQQDYANGVSNLDTVTAAITDYQKTALQLRRHQADRLVILAEIEQLVGRPLHGE